MKHWVPLLVTSILLSSISMAAERAFQPTKPGVMEIKTIPGGLLIASHGDGNYFDRSNDLFMPLFRYIQRNDIAMTVPVEATVEPASMYFWIAPEEVHKAEPSTDRVEVIEMQPRTVLSVGGRGGYSEANYLVGKSELKAWLSTNKKWRAKGDPFVVYWSGPMTPAFLKTYEIQVELERRS